MGSGFVITTMMIPFLFALYCVFFAVSEFNKVYVRLTFHKKDRFRAAGLDAAWGLDPPESPPFIYGIFKSSGKPNLEKLKNHFLDRICNVKKPNGDLMFPKMTYKLVQLGGYYYWEKDTQFDIGNHMKLVDLSEKYPGCDGETKVQKYLEDNCRMTICNGNTSPWEFRCFIIGPNEHYKMMKIHHAIGDGLSLIRLMLEYMCDGHRECRPYGATPKLTTKLKVMFVAYCMLPYAIMLLLNKGKMNPLNTDKLSGKKFFISAPECKLSAVKHIRSKTKTTFQNILLTAISTTLHTQLQKKSYKGSEYTHFIPIGYTDMKAALKLENTFVLGLARLPLPKEPQNPQSSLVVQNTLNTLYETNRAMNKVKNELTVMSIYYLLYLMGNIIPICVAKIVFNVTGITIGSSNVPGPEEKNISMAAQNIDSMTFWAPDKSPMGMTIAFFSYGDSFKPSLCIDSSLVRDREEAQQIMDNVISSITRMSEILSIE